MESLLTRRAVGTAIALTFLTACAGAAGGVPAAGVSTQGAAIHDRGPAYPNLSGEYSGKFVDGVYGKGNGSAIYSQYQNAFGGQLTIKYKTQTIAESVSQTYSGASAGGSVSGSTTSGAGSLYCTFSTTANYDTSTHVLSGSFTAAHGCAGETGTFSLKHLCTFKGTTHEDIRPDNGPRPC